MPAKSYIQTIPFGAIYTYNQVRLILSLPAQIIRGNLAPEEGRFIGLKGIYDLFGQAISRDVESREPAAPALTSRSLEPSNFTIQLIASLTLTLGIFNLLPFPALDGGRILFVLPELVMRRRVPPQFENWVHTVGFACYCCSWSISMPWTSSIRYSYVPLRYERHAASFKMYWMLLLEEGKDIPLVS